MNLNKVYDYCDIEADFDISAISKTVVEYKVEKPWLSNNKVTNMALYQFDKKNSKWIQSNASEKNQDDTYKFYTSDMTSFTYLAVAQAQNNWFNINWLYCLIPLLLILLLLLLLWWLSRRRKEEEEEEEKEIQNPNTKIQNKESIQPVPTDNE